MERNLGPLDNTNVEQLALKATFSPKMIFPKLPVPALDETLAKYLMTVEPLLSSSEYLRTKELVEEFGAVGGIGEELQNMLEERASKCDNWLHDWWLSQRYLGYRKPITVYQSPGLLFPLQEFASIADQLSYAAKMVAGALDYKRLLEIDELPQETLGKAPFDMYQYYCLLGTCRIPGIPEDTLKLQDPKNLATHIVVVHNHQFFKVEVCDSNGNSLTQDQLTDVLYQVVVNSTEPCPPVGAFTTQPRDVWVQVHQSLMKDPSNAASVAAIQDSLFVLALDRLQSTNANVNRLTDAALKMIHGKGAGAQGNAGNRWYDKTIQLVVGEEGITGITFEHSPSEGVSIAFLMDHIVDYVNHTSTLNNAEETLPTPKPEPLEFNLNEDLKNALDDAVRDLDVLVNDFELNVFTFPSFGKEDIKAMRLSPDSFIQVSIQLAFYRTHGVPGAHYETASTKRFMFGRTESIRSCLPEVVEFCKKMADCSANASDLKRAIEAHKQYVLEAVNGQGVDRHLMGLRLLCIANDMEIPLFFEDPAYVRSSSYRISSSQVAARSDGIMFFRPVVSSGYGVCYNPMHHSINISVSAYNSGDETNAATLAKAIEASLRDMNAMANEFQA